MTSSEGSHHHFTIISKFVCWGCYMKNNAAFTLISFAVLKWDECLSVQLPFELPVELPVCLFLELEPDWLDQNVNELQFELRIYLECRWNGPMSCRRNQSRILQFCSLIDRKYGNLCIITPISLYCMLKVVWTSTVGVRGSICNHLFGFHFALIEWWELFPPTKKRDRESENRI